MQHLSEPYSQLSSAELTQQTIPRFRQSGFTLLEMVLVLFLIGLLASAGLLFTEGVEDQAKYDETKRRMELIRKAIVGDPTRTINGAPEISGFVADMGRLPFCLAELLVPGEMSGVPADNAFVSPCSDSSNNLAIKGWQIAEGNNIGHGWRGPYIQVIPDSDNELRFRDGYGNGEDDDINFGWRWLLFDEDGDLLSLLTEAKSAVKASLQSAGFDPVSPNDDIPMGDIETITSLIDENAWLTADSFSISFQNTSALSDVEIEPEYWSVDLGKNSAPEFEKIIIPGELPSYTVEPGKSVEIQAKFEKKIPLGVYYLKVSCEGSSSCPNDELTNPYQIVLLPKHHNLPFVWRVAP